MCFDSYKRAFIASIATNVMKSEERKGNRVRFPIYEGRFFMDLDDREEFFHDRVY